MNLQEYIDTGRSRYEKLAKIVSQLLERAITIESGYRLQQIQHRAKTVQSLRRRLKENGHIHTEEIEVHRKDLAGCRIVFYTNSDVGRFVHSGLLRELFDIDLDRSKFHQFGPAQHSVDQLFQSHNYVIKLKSDREALLEYRELEGLYCEVQIQTSLNHAWAEMAHDTIYKRPDFQGFGNQQLQLIESRLKDVMLKHLLPAGYLFQRIATDVDQLAEGKALFDSGIFDKILAAENNNDRYYALVQLKDYVLPHYDDLPELFLEVEEKLKQTWLVATETGTVPLGPPYRGLWGWESHHITAQISEIMEQLRFLDPDKTYIFIRDLFVQTTNSRSRDQLVRLAEQLARPTLQIWEKYGPFVQVQLAEALAKESDIRSMTPIAIVIAREILCTEITGTTSRSDSVTIHRGAVTFSQALQRARRSAIDVILRIAQASIGDDDVLMRATRPLLDGGREPRTAGLRHDLASMISEDLAYAIERMLPIAVRASMNARQNLESMLLHCWRLNKSLPKEFAMEPKSVAAHKRLIRSIIDLRKALNKDKEFVVFKTIVGYNSVFPHQWEEDDWDFKRDKTIRNQRQDRLADSITEENWPTWKSRLKNAADVKSIDRATFPPYSRFLSLIAARQPKLAFELLTDRDLLPDWTIKPISCVLLDSEFCNEVKNLIGRWVDDGCFLPEIADLATSPVDTLLDLVPKIVAHVVKKCDVNACTILVLGAIRRHQDDPQFWRDDVFFPCLKVLQEAENHNWIEYSSHQSGKDRLFNNLADDQCEAVLAAILKLCRIDYQAEQILNSIALTHHQSVIDWFGKRIQVSCHEPSLELEPVPFQFQKIHKALQPHPRDIMTSIRQWIHLENSMHNLDALHFLSKVYPEFDEPLPSSLLDFVDNADTSDLAFLSSSLKGFNGQPKLVPVLRAMLASEKADDTIEDEVLHIFLETGVMSGEFGGAEAYQAKIKLLEPWLEDKNARVVKFAEREISSLENMVASENRRAQEQIAMRKLQYGESLEDGDTHQDDDNA